MKLLACFSALLFSTSALAAENVTIKLETDGLITFYQLTETGEMTTPDGLVLKYSWNDSRDELCTDVPDLGVICTLFDTSLKQIGDSSRYQMPDLGQAGKATLIETEN